MFRIVPHGMVSNPARDQELPKSSIAHYPSVDEVPATIKKLFKAASYYGVKYPVARKDLISKMDDVYWGRSGQAAREIIEKALTDSDAYKLSYQEVLDLVKGKKA